MKEQITVPCRYCKMQLPTFVSDAERLLRCTRCNSFTKVPAQEAKRIQLNCPECKAPWNISAQLRGQTYQCWNCGIQSPILGIAQINIIDAAFEEQMEQGGQNSVLLTIENKGTSATLGNIKMSFVQGKNDLTPYYQTRVENMPGQIEHGQPIQVICYVQSLDNTPPGLTNILIQVEGYDALDHSPVTALGEIQWLVCHRRIFSIETEHEYQETAGVPFHLKLWACLINGEVDTSYQGSHYIEFLYKSNVDSPFKPDVPQGVDLFFQQGMAATHEMFTLYDASSKVEIQAGENAPGGPKGISEIITVKHNDFYTFDICLQSPQIDHCPFHGRNTIRAVDQYGNVVEDFAQDVWLYPTNNRGEIEISGIVSNIIPANSFRGGMSDLASLGLTYNTSPKDFLPLEISFIISFQNKEECSEPIFIEPNPVQISISQIIAPEAVERNEQFELILEITNKSKYDLRMNPNDFRFAFSQEENSVDSFYKIHPPHAQIINLPSTATNTQNNPQVRVPILVEVDPECPFGRSTCSIIVFAYDPINAWYGRAVNKYTWQIVPSGRIFKLIEPSLQSIEAGVPFSITVAAYWQEQIDCTYNGKHTLLCECHASESPNNIPNQVPEKIDIDFENGAGKTNPCFVFTNASEVAKLILFDPEAGGPKSEEWNFEVRPGALEFFLVNLQQELQNSHCFDEANQIMAMDAYGNLITNFSQNCQIVSAHKKGTIYFNGKTNNTIPSTAFHQGIADLNELKISYHSSVPANLPDPEEFIVSCNYKKGQSKPVLISPRPGKLNIVRCSAPEEVEQAGEDYPIYIELENQGDRTVDISSAVFMFSHQNEDISTCYSIQANPNNTTLLTAGIPLQLIYTVKVGSKAPIGVTNVNVKISGVDSQSKLPMQSTAQFQWRIEPKQRFFRVVTEHENQETAGVLFNLKISSHLENQQRDPSLQGEYTLEFISNATAINANSPEVPSRLTLSFIRGESTTPRIFKLVNAGENPFIQVKDNESRAQGHTGPIRLLYDANVNFNVHLDFEVTNTKPLRGQNTIIVSDAFGNIKKNFQNEIPLQFSSEFIYLTNTQGQKISSIRGDWFKEGVADLTTKDVCIYSQDEAKLPINVQLQLFFQNKLFSSNPIRVLASPVVVNFNKIEVPEKVIPGQPFLIHIEMNNRGIYPVDISQFNFFLYQGDTTFRDYKIIRVDQTNSKIVPGTTTLAYQVQLSASIGYGKIVGKIGMLISGASGQKVSLPDMPFTLYVEATGRIFTVTTENSNREIAGSPFFLYITAILDHDTDIAYEGSHQIYFKSNATASPNGQVPIIPETLTVSFSKGKAISPKEFYLFHCDEGVSIQVREPLTNTTGSSEEISALPGEFGRFTFQTADKQTHTFPFVGENRLIVYDIFGNLHKNFQSDVRLSCKSKKGKLTFGKSTSNLIPRSQFQQGVAELTSLGIVYAIEEVNSLPLVDQLVATFQERDFFSSEITIAPRPAELKIENLKLGESFYQGTMGIPLGFILKNTGDSKALLSNVKFTFSNAGNDVTSQFNLLSHPQNRSMVLAQSESVLNYFLDVHANTTVGNVEVSIFVQANDSQYDKTIETKEVAKIQILEKLREFKIETEHNNQEIAGVPFAVKLIATKDKEPDHTYHGNHEISFILESKLSNHRHPPTYPQKETIQFVRGHGHTSPSFILTDTNERITIRAEEKGKASGSSTNIALAPAKMRSFKIIFPQDKPYQIQPLDTFDNVLPQQPTLDEDVKTGAILSGTSGMFYEVQDIIGHGAMGKVYRGKRINDGLEVAIKTTLFSNLSDINRFLMEGLTLIRFNHPNIVKGYDLRQLCVQENNRVACKLFMVMEYLPGQTAKDVLDSSKSGVLPPLYATKIILYAARALAYMWENQTLHRDIKPENIQITQKDEVKLIDLGIARAESGEMDVTITRHDTIVGSYPYLSPERLKEGTPVDFRSDMYSLGATYYQLLAGIPPYFDLHKDSNKDLLEFLLQVRTKRMPTPIHQIIPVPMIVSDTVTTMLSLKAQKRFQSPEEMLTVLEKVYQELANK